MRGRKGGNERGRQAEIECGSRKMNQIKHKIGHRIQREEELRDEKARQTASEVTSERGEIGEALEGI